jgi:hypothetical protein
MIISCGDNYITIENVGNNEIRLILKTSDPFIKPFPVTLNRSLAKALINNLQLILDISNKDYQVGREKAQVLRDIRTKLLEIYSEDEDVENELDCASDELSDAIEKLEEKYGK